MKKYLLVSLLLLISCSNAQSRKLTQKNLAFYPWQFVSPMPHGRYAHDAIYAPNGKIYAMGGLVFKVARGFNKDNKLNSWLIDKYNDGRYSNLAYNPQTDQWEYMTSVPGIGHDEYVTFYYPDEDKWSEKRGSVRKLTEVEENKLCQSIEKRERPKKIYETDFIRQGNGVAIVALTNDMLLWVGGGDFLGDIANIALPYSLKKDSWPGLIRKEYKFNPGIAKTIYEKDQREMYQTDIPPMLEPRRDHCAVGTTDGKIYVIGGWHKETAINKWGGKYNTGKGIVSMTMECYDPKKNKWEYKKPLYCERMDFAAVTGKDDKIYVFGGAVGMSDDPTTQVLNTIEVYDPKIDSWSFRKPMPVKRTGHSAAMAADGRIYIIGGSEWIDQPQNTVYIYDSEIDVWEKGPDMILPRSALAVAASPDGKIYAIGGSDVGAYNDKDQWQRLANLISADELGNYNGKVQDTVEVLDINKWRKSKKEVSEPDSKNRNKRVDVE